MYEKFSDRARKVMQLAREEAQRLHHEYIGTEHILLGLTIEGGGVGFSVLQALSIDLIQVKAEVLSRVLHGSEPVTAGSLPQTPRARRVVELAIEESVSYGCKNVGTDHILLGLLQEPEGIGYQVLKNLGVTEDRAREALVRFGFATKRVDERAAEERVADAAFAKGYKTALDDLREWIGSKS